MVDEDEDVILSHSPLDKYLQEVTDFDFSKFHLENDLCSIQDELSNNSKDSSYLPLRLKEKLLQKQLHCKELLQCCHLLLNVSGLTEGDESLLMELKEELEKDLCSSEHTSKSNNKSFYLDTTWIFLGLIIALFTIATAYLSRSGRYEDLFAIAMVCVIIVLTTWYYIKDIKNLPNKLKTRVKRFEKGVNSYNKLLDKIVVHLKEVEVINQGYAAFKSSILFAKSKGKTCAKLRTCTLDSLVSLFTQIRLHQRIILQQPDCDFPFDYKEEYLATMPLEAFSELLYPNVDNNHIDSPLVPIDRIKTLICLFRAQLSEFIYRVIVSFYIAYRRSKSIDLKVAHELVYSMEDINKNLSETVNVLDAIFKMSLKAVYQRKRCQAHATQQKHTANTLLHSSQFHLHSALSRIDEIKQVCEDKPTQENVESLELIKSLIIQYNIALDNSKSCVEDVLESFLPKQDKMKPETNFNESGATHADQVNYVMFEKRAEDGDVLLEGESEQANITIKNDDANIEDVEKISKEHRQSRRLMKELRSILAVKESPIGLVSFPLCKIASEELQTDSDDEYTCGKDVEKKNLNEQKPIKRHYDYLPGNDDGDSDENHTFQQDVVRMGLPVRFLNLSSRHDIVEETYGSTDDENEHAEQQTEQRMEKVGIESEI